MNIKRCSSCLLHYSKCAVLFLLFECISGYWTVCLYLLCMHPSQIQWFECVYVLCLPLYVSAQLRDCSNVLCCAIFSTTERWSKPQEHWPKEEFCDTVTEIRQIQTHMPSIHTVAKQESCILIGSSMHEWCLVCSSCGCKMAFSDGEIKYFSWRLGVAWSCGKDIWHLESCYLQYSMWKNFRPALYICRRVENASLGLNNKWKVFGPTDLCF